MDKEQAIQLIHQARRQGRTAEDISIDLSLRMKAPLDLTRRFVYQVLAAESTALQPSLHGVSPSSEPETSRDEELAAMILGGLLQHTPHNDLVLQVCHSAGLDWDEAEKKVAEIEQANRVKIVRRNTLIFVPLSILFILVGLTLLWLTTEITLAMLFEFLAIPFVLGPVQIVYFQNAPLYFALGFGLFIGGAIGLYKALQELFST